MKKDISLKEIKEYFLAGAGMMFMSFAFFGCFIFQALVLKSEPLSLKSTSDIALGLLVLEIQILFAALGMFFLNRLRQMQDNIS